MPIPRKQRVDPELMRTAPPKMTAYQGFDALFHSVEGYISNGTNLMSDMYAITAIENISRYLARAVRDGSAMEARERVAFGNTLSGTVMCVGRCASKYSLEHAMSAFHQELPHGAGLIMISKAYYTHFINLHVCDERFVRMARAIGMKNVAPLRISSPYWRSCKRNAAWPISKYPTTALPRMNLKTWPGTPETLWDSCSCATAFRSAMKTASPYTGRRTAKNMTIRKAE